MIEDVDSGVIDIENQGLSYLFPEIIVLGQSINPDT